MSEYVFRFLLLSLGPILTVAAILPAKALANFEYSPIVGELSTTGKQSFLLAKVTSHDDADIPVIVRIFERSMSASGEEIRTPSEELVAFPPQLILPAKSQKFIKIAWRGGAELVREKAFRILVEHAPVDLSASKRGTASVRILTNYSGMIYVNSRPSTANIIVKSIVKSPKARTLDLEIANDGDRHLVLAAPVLEVSCAGAAKDSFVLKGPALQNLESVNMLAGSSLKVSVSAPAKIPPCPTFTSQLRYSLK